MAEIKETDESVTLNQCKHCGKTNLMSNERCNLTSPQGLNYYLCMSCFVKGVRYSCRDFYTSPTSTYGGENNKQNFLSSKKFWWIATGVSFIIPFLWGGETALFPFIFTVSLIIALVKTFRG